MTEVEIDVDGLQAAIDDILETAANLRAAARALETRAEELQETLDSLDDEGD